MLGGIHIADTITLYIRISAYTRLWLDQSRKPNGRATFAGLVHSEYRDNRPDWLKEAKRWSVEPRPLQTSICITLAQSHELIDMAVEHNVTIPKTLSPLLGQFLDAIAHEWLLPVEDE